MTKAKFLKKWLEVSKAYSKIKDDTDDEAIKIKKQYKKLLNSKEAKSFIIASWILEIK